MSPVWRVLAASFILLASFAVWFLSRRDSAMSSPVVTPSPSAVTTEHEEVFQDGSTIATTPTPEPPVTSPAIAEKHVTTVPKRTPERTSVSTLEQQIRATRLVEERIEFITELAHMDSAEAVFALERVFTIERHPKAQVALIASLTDVDPALQPDARLRILRAALTNQPRDVRTTALEVLAESEESASRELLRKSSVSDPDREVREVAAALYQANSR